MKERGCSSRPPAAGTGFFCTVCPNKCAWSDHHNMPFKFIVEEVTVTKTYDDLKKKYQEKGTEAINKRGIIKKMYEEVLGLQLNAIDTIADMHKARADLMELALKPDGLSNIQFIGQMIEAEKSTQKMGWKDRVRQLETMRSKLLLVGQAKSAADIQEKLFSDPDPDFNLETLISDAVDVSAVSKVDEMHSTLKSFEQMFGDISNKICVSLDAIFGDSGVATMFHARINELHERPTAPNSRKLSQEVRNTLRKFSKSISNQALTAGVRRKSVRKYSATALSLSGDANIGKQDVI